MLLLNFSHPVTLAQQNQIETLTAQVVDRIIDAMPHFEEQRPFGPQVQALLTQVDLTPQAWQSEPILVVLPSLNFIAAALLAELHGRMGHFPAIIRMRPVAGSLVTHYEVAELINLQALRDHARQQRRTELGS